MAYVIRKQEPIDAEVRRVLLEQNRRALRLLQRWEENPRDRVHEARQAFKRIRALLRLIRPGARYVYGIENSHFRDLGRKLAHARDTEAVIDALDLLKSGVSAPLAGDAMRRLKAQLEQRAVRERNSGPHDLSGRVRSVCRDLLLAEERMGDLPLTALRRRDLRQGVDEGIARCVQAFGRASESRAAEDFHAWRKAVKTAYHQTRLMQQILFHWSARHGAAFGALADVLGHHHDVVMLDVLLGSRGADFELKIPLRVVRRPVRLAMIALSEEALVMGRDLFSGRAVAHVTRL